MSDTVVVDKRVLAGFEAVALRNDYLEVLLLPRVGAKIVSLRYLPTGREWLWRDPSRRLRETSNGGAFADYDLSGMDECFPTIAPCPAGAHVDRPLPDHGDLWSRPWRCVSIDGGVETSVTGDCLPYRFARSTILAGASVRFEYTLENLREFPMPYLWAAHPLFAISPGMRVEVPGTPTLIKEFGVGGRVGPDDESGRRGYLSRHLWPEVVGADGHIFDLREITSPTPGTIDKVYAIDLEEGWAQLHEPVNLTRLEIRWSLKQVPYLGLCMNMGAWPTTGTVGRWVAMEPCTATSDQLGRAAARGECSVLPPRTVRRWWMSMSVGRS